MKIDSFCFNNDFNNYIHSHDNCFKLSKKIQDVIKSDDFFYKEKIIGGKLIIIFTFRFKHFLFFKSLKLIYKFIKLNKLLNCCLNADNYGSNKYILLRFIVECKKE